MVFLGYSYNLRRKEIFSKNKTEVKTEILDQKRHELFSKSHPLKLILSLSIAPVLVIVVNALYQLSDTFLTALLTDDKILINGELTSLSTISINTSMIVWTPLWALTIGLVQGSLAWLTKAQGAQDAKKMGEINSSAFLFISVIAFASSLVCVAVAKEVLELGVSIPDQASREMVIDQAFRYIWPRLATLPLVTIYLYLVRTMRTLNIRFWTTIPYIVAVCLNLLFDYILIEFAKWGIFGSGFATAIADFVSMSLALTIFIRHMRKEKPEFKLFRPKGIVMWQILLLGFPNILNLWLRSILLFFTIKWSSEIGALGVASAMRVVDSLVIYPGFGFIQGAMIGLGYAYGNKNYKRLHSITKWLGYAISTYFLVLTFILFFISGTLLDLLQIAEPRGVDWMRLAYVGLVLLSVGETMRPYYSATHQKIKALIFSMTTTLSPIPFLFLFGSEMKDLELYWYSYILGDVLAFTCIIVPFFFLFYRGHLFKKGIVPKVFYLERKKVTPNVKKIQS